MYSSSTTTLPLLLITSLLALTTTAQQQSVTSTVTFTSGAIPRPTGNPTNSYTSNDQFRNDMLFAHNFYRGAHNASDLTWNETLARVGAEWSEGCEFEHSGGPTGENLALGYPNATANVDAWALERIQYNFDRPGFDSKTGHFTQLVWRNTTSVGCGRTNCTGKNNLQGWLVVCEYWPVGNVAQANGGNQFYRDNVLRQIEGKQTDTVASGVSSTSGSAGARDGLWAAGVLMAAGVVGMGIAL